MNGEPCTTKEDIKELVEYYKNIVEMNEQLSAVRKDCAVRAETFSLVIAQIEEIINNNSL